MSVAAAGDIAAQRADGFRERADLDVHAAVNAEMIDRAAPVARRTRRSRARRRPS